jgi:hypothetical protein
MPNKIVHTDMPIAPLSLLIGEHARIEVGSAALSKKDCFYGWGEAMASPVSCKPHHLVFTPDETFLSAIADTIYNMGHQVVMTDYQDWSEDQVAYRYDNDHQH